MGLRINTNIASINAQKNLARTQLDLNRALDRLSSGLRITRAGDDAAGLAISESLRAQIRGLGHSHRPGRGAVVNPDARSFRLVVDDLEEHLPALRVLDEVRE